MNRVATWKLTAHIFIIRNIHYINYCNITYLIDTFGTKNGIFVGSLLGIIGVTVRLFCNTSFVFVIIGQIIAITAALPLIKQNKLP